MAEMKQRLNGDGDESSHRKQANKSAIVVQMPGVNFEELNFEQRRAPYNSGSRFINDKKHDRPIEDNPEHEPDNDWKACLQRQAFFVQRLLLK